MQSHSNEAVPPPPRPISPTGDLPGYSHHTDSALHPAPSTVQRPDAGWQSRTPAIGLSTGPTGPWDPERPRSTGHGHFQGPESSIPTDGHHLPPLLPPARSPPEYGWTRQNFKHPLGRISTAAPGPGIVMSDPPPVKKLRTASPTRGPSNVSTAGIDGLVASVGQAPVTEAEAEATSPMFFSYASSSWAAAETLGPRSPDHAMSILSRTEEAAPGSVTTLKLPQPYAGPVPHVRPGSTPGSLTSSMDMSAPALSPDVRWPAAGLHALTGLDLLELLEHETRLTFLVDLADPLLSTRSRLHILFQNATLRSSTDTLRLIAQGQARGRAHEEYAGFKGWVLETRDPHPKSYTYGGFIWTAATVRKRFRVVYGSVDPDAEPDEPMGLLVDEPVDDAVILEPPVEDNPLNLPVTPEVVPAEPPDYFGNTIPKDFPDIPLSAGLPIQPSAMMFDWTKVPLTDQLPEHIKLARAVDWSSTSLGPVEQWPPTLRSMSNLVMGSPNPAAMYLGPELVALYNAAYIDIAGQKHPSLMGRSYPDIWYEIWPEMEPAFRDAWESGQSVMKHDQQYFINRHGYLEEAFFTWSVVPILGDEGEVAGIYNSVFEGTRRKVTERRMFTLREIGELTASATTVKGFWPQVQKGLGYNEHDVPFGLIYSVKDDGDGRSSPLSSPGGRPKDVQLLLEGSIGVPEHHPAAVGEMGLEGTDEGFAPYMRQSIANKGEVVVLSEDDGTLPHHLVSNLDWRGYGDPCRTIVVFPVIPNTANRFVVGFIVMGVNPRRPYDSDYRLFIHLLSRQLATSMASVVLFETEIKRGQRAATRAALDRQKLLRQLQKKSREADESEYKFTRMAEFAPVGMFIADSQGNIDYCNDMLWQITGVAPTEKTENAWMDSVRPEDRHALDEEWARLLNDRVTISVEFRFMGTRRDGDVTMDTWVLMSAYPEKNADGTLKSIFGCITDISSQKWAEKVQSERREEAVELRRQQENFIDITSHEMRNPLSAVLQCADQITSSISSFTDHGDKEAVQRLLEDCVDAANTINLCSSHQKRIVDDISTLSKLDSNLLGVAPIDEQPVRVIQRALRMFEAELLSQDIEFEFVVDRSFKDHGIEWAKMDPSRFRQVLINLMTNAIKFTSAEERRAITVTVAVSKDISPVADDGLHYFDRSHNPKRGVTDVGGDPKEWGDGERITIHCSIQDTGPGMAREELQRMFERFKHGIPRTHVQYGSSGLGLFISRFLTEMQGGQIGVSSRPGEGSTVSFYVQSRVSVDPPSNFGPIPTLKMGRQREAALASPVAGGRRGSISIAPTWNSPAVDRESFDVLIVEDNIVNQKVLQRQLTSCGNTTFVANHGEEALQALERSKFWAGQEADGVHISVVLMDLEMPVMDGMTCTRKIRELEQKGTIVQHIPIIAVTAYSRPEQIEDAKAAGIDDVVSKPFRMMDLLERIEELVGKRRDATLVAA